MKSSKVSTLVRLALLSAIIVIMAFTPLGFLNIGPFAITFLTIPVIIGAITMGPAARPIFRRPIRFNELYPVFSGQRARQYPALD